MRRSGRCRNERSNLTHRVPQSHCANFVEFQSVNSGLRIKVKSPRTCCFLFLVFAWSSIFAAEDTKVKKAALPLWMSAPEARPFLERGRAAGRQWRAASDAFFNDPTTYGLKDLVSLEVIQRKRKLVEEASEAWSQLLETNKDRSEKLRSALKQSGASAARIEEVMVSFHQTKESVEALFQSEFIRHPPIELLYDLTREMLDFAEANFGTWGFDANGKVLFSDSKLRGQYQDLVRRMREWTDQTNAQSEDRAIRAKAATERTKKE
jgi:Fe-S cluster assembly iron-binding protein IscA